MTQMMEPMCDSHAHLNFPELAPQAVEVMRRAAEAGVTLIINIGTQPSTNEEVLQQVRSLPSAARAAGFEPPELRAALGFHPHEARVVTEADWATLERQTARQGSPQAADPLVVALGEFGLDFHYEHSPRALQREVMHRGIDLAQRSGLPLVIHSREAGFEVIEALDRAAAQPGRTMPRGVFHCFTDAVELAEAAVERGFYVGFTGIVTYPNAENVRQAARRVPLGQMLVETDAPFCTPEPVRSERRKKRGKGRDEPNEPALVGGVCAKVAELHGVTADEVRRATLENARRLFGLLAGH